MLSEPNIRVRRLLKTAQPVPGESLRGLVADACARNRIPNTWGMLRHFGVVHRNRIDVSENDQIRYDELAATLGVHVGELDVRRYPSSPGWRRTFFGVEMLSAQIENRIRRFSPAAIAEGHTYHPATHELRDLPFSLIGWDLLQDRCSCECQSLRQNWTRVNGTSRCNFCGASLSRIDPKLIPPQLRSTLSVISGIVDPRENVRAVHLARLPEPIRNSSRTKLFDVLTKLAKVAGTHFPNDGSHEFQPVYQLARACEALLSWPDGFAHVAQRSREKDCPWTKLARNYLLLDQCSEGGSALHSSSPDSNATYSSRGRFGNFGQAHISTAEAARLTGLDEPALIEAWNDGLFTQHRSAFGFHEVRAFDREELFELAPKLRVKVARKLASNQLGITVYGLEQMICLGVFNPAPPGRDRSQQLVHREEVARIGALIRNRAKSKTSDYLPLSDAMRFVSGRPHPWGTVIASLCRAQIPYHLQSGTAPLVERLMIPRECISELQGHSFDRSDHVNFEFAKRWDQGDSLACLNMHRCAGQLLSTLKVEGVKPKLFLASEVEELAARAVATSDLGRRAGLSVAAVSWKLKKLNCEEVLPGLWKRETAEKALLG